MKFISTCNTIHITIKFPVKVDAVTLLAQVILTQDLY